MKALANLAAMAALAALAACAVADPPPRDSFYRLVAGGAPAPLPKSLLPGVLEVARFTADGLASERALLYSPAGAPESVQRYQYHFWNDPPPAMLHDRIVGYLRQAKVAGAVSTPDLRMRPDWVLQGRIKRFEQVTGDKPAVAIEVELALTDLRRDEVVLVETYAVEKPAAGDRPEDAVRAASAAVDDLLSRFIEDVRRRSGA